MNTEKIKEFKEIYLGTKVPDAIIEEGWKTLSNRLPYQDNSYIPFYKPLRFAVLSASILLLFIVSGLGFAKYATPNSILYPLKGVSNKIYGNLDEINGKVFRPTPKISQPAMDIIAPNSTITPIVSPTLSPTPVKKQEDKENDNEDRKPNSTTQQDVKGASTTNQSSNESKDGSSNKDNNGNNQQNHSQSNEGHGNGNSSRNHDD